MPAPGSSVAPARTQVPRQSLLRASREPRLLGMTVLRRDEGRVPDLRLRAQPSESECAFLLLICQIAIIESSRKLMAES